MSTTPWQPASRLDVPDLIQKKYLKGVGYRGRFIRKANLDAKLQEGWEIVNLTPDEVKLISPSEIVDGKPLTTQVQRRELILCRMSLEMVKSRAEFFRRKGTTNLEEINNEFERTTPTKYGSIKVEK